MKNIKETVILNERTSTTHDAKEFHLILTTEFGVNLYSCDRFFSINDDNTITKSRLFDKKRYRPIYAYIDTYMVKVGNSYGYDLKEYASMQGSMIDKQYYKVQASIAYMEENDLV